MDALSSSGQPEQTPSTVDFAASAIVFCDKLNRRILTMRITGQCHCGAISFTAVVDPKRVIACHCTDCQAISGAPFRAVLPVPAEDVSLVGNPKQYVKVAASGNRRVQAFCAECGTQLYASEPDIPKTLNIRLGCVNERAQLPPTVQIWGNSEVQWLHSLSSIPMHSAGMSSPLMQMPVPSD
jgi:hypothetical protein